MAGETLAKLFADAARKNASRAALRWKKHKEWRELSYAELESRVRDFAGALIAMGLRKGDRVAIFARNSPEWAIADWANVTSGFVTVPIYDTLTADKAAYILKDAGAKIVIVQSKEHLEKVRTIEKQLKDLKHIIVVEEVFEKSLDANEHLFEDVLKEGAAATKKHPDAWTKMRADVKPEDLCSIVYTSGTTGEPKGVMLTQNNFASNVVSCLTYFPIEAGEIALSFLPLSHVFERMAGHFTMIHAGVTIVYAESIEKVPENLLEVRPHTMMSVPRLYEKVYARVLEKVRHEGFLKRFIFHKGVDTGKRYMHEKYTLKVLNPSNERKFKRYNRLVYSKIQERMGGRIKFVVSGGAALNKEIEEFFNAVNVPIFQGYGLTETSPVIAFNNFNAMRFGSVGKPLPEADVRIADDGEILVKGPMVMKGYWQKPDATKEAFTPDGYFRTGDIGRLDEDGFLYVTDRKKELIVMSNGKKVAPQPIENTLRTKPGIGQVVLLGNQRNYITALVWPDLEALRKYADENGLKYQDPKELLAEPKVRALLDKSFADVNEGLSRYEQIKRFHVIPGELVAGAPELTPSLKIKRRVVDERYEPQIRELYNGDGRMQEAQRAEA